MAPEELIINQSLRTRRRKHRTTTLAVLQDLFPTETITEHRPTTLASEDLFPTEALSARRLRDSPSSGTSTDDIVTSDDGQVHLSKGTLTCTRAKRLRACSSSSTTTDDNFASDDIHVHQSQVPETSMMNSSSTEYVIH